MIDAFKCSLIAKYAPSNTQISIQERFLPDESEEIRV